MKYLLSKLSTSEYICFILILLLLVSGFVHYRTELDLNYKTAQLSALSDTITLYKTKDNKNAAYISILKGSKKDLEEILSKKDPKSAEIIKKTKGITSLTNLSTVTKIDTVVRVDTISIVNNNTDEKVSPDSIDFKASKFIDNKYYKANISVHNDSIDLSLQVINDFKIITRNKSNGLFKRKTLIVEVINDNPYTITTGLSKYEIDKPKSKLGLKLGTLALTVAGAVILLK